MKRTLTWAFLSSAAMSAIFCDPSGAQAESVRALIQEARAEAKQGNHSQAAMILDRAKAIAPNSEAVLSDFAKNSLAAGDPVGAINALEPLTRMHPEVAEYPYMLGVARLQIKEFASSVDALQHSLDLEPQRALTMIALGITLISQKQFSEAKEFLARSLEIEPENAEALAVLAEAEEGLNEVEQAEIHANRALALVGSHGGAYYVLGKVRMSQGRFVEARDFLLQAIDLSAASPRVHYQLSLAYARLNDPENSKKHREIHLATRNKNEKSIEMMRKRAGLKESGMGPTG